jgi:hypothetical protein
MGKISKFGFLLGAVLAFNSASQSFGADSSCGNIVEPNNDLIKAIMARSALNAFAGNSKVPPFLEGIEPQILKNDEVNDHQGSVLFVKRDAKWTLVAPYDGEADQGIFVSPQSDEVFIFTMLATEGPGSSYTLVRASDRFNKFDCLTIPFPKSVKNPENFLELQDFNLDAQGNGSLVGSADIERGRGSKVSWFRYSTSDFGRTWSAPVKLAGKPKKIPGIFNAVALRPDLQLQTDMQRYFGVGGK